MSEKRVAPPDGGSGDLVLIQRHLENLSAGEILEELDARMEEMTDQSCDPELIRLYLDVLEDLHQKKGVEITVELGLQTPNYHTLAAVGRGHTLAEFIDGVLRVRCYGFDVCALSLIHI